MLILQITGIATVTVLGSLLWSKEGFIAYQKEEMDTHENQPVACSKHTCTSNAQLMPEQNKDRKNISHANWVGG